MTNLSLLTDQLHAAAPQTELLTSVGDLRRFAVDDVTPQLVALPASVEDVAALLKLAGEQQLAVLPVGGSTELTLGQPPERYDLAICTARLNALLEHEAADLTCSVQAGMTLADLQQRLATKGQFLALDPPNNEQATIGGILAANASGPQRLRYGAARDLVIGLRVVLGDGTIARSGGKVVKNVAGYDLNKLYIGSLGTLGIIVEANFKLIPRPEHEETLLIAFENASAAMETVIALLSSVVTPTALELLDPAAQQSLPEQARAMLPGPAYLLATSFSSVAKAVTRQLADSRAIATSHAGSPRGNLEGTAHDTFWAAVRARQIGPVVCKVSLLINDVAPFLAEAQTICQEQQLESSAIAHAGSGVIYLQLGPADALDRLAAAIGKLRNLALQDKGSLVITHAPTALKAQINVWGEARPDLRLMGTLKRKFDPADTLVKGRFVGGL
ncbi:MAG TPA: FAD-binding oxidoreductase [Ktedonobacterales bacterium]|nr:FAD-binding oxidoreductase [Ktedonobacterales bacterium]